MPSFILSIDQGTTSTRAMVFDDQARQLSVSQRLLPQIFPKPGWVEHDPEEIWASVTSASADAVQKAGIRPSELTAIGITNQRETTVAWDAITGQPVYNAIVWQSRQSSEICDELISSGHENMITAKTGLLADPYFSGSKMAWIIRNVPEALKLLEEGRLRFGTVDSWLVYKMSGGRRHCTDASNASRTLLFNIHTMEWDKQLASIFGVTRDCLPEVSDSSGFITETSPDAFLGVRVPITGIAGDQQAALFGQLCFSPGDVKSTYGTGSFLLMNAGNSPPLSNNGLLATIAWSIAGKPTYALEGSIFATGSAVQWLKDGLGIITSANETDAVAMSVPDTAGVYFVPAFGGLGTPYWNKLARGTITGITRGTNRAHIVRATLEAVAYQTRDVINAMEQDTDISTKSLKVDGGMVGNDFLLQLIADILSVEVVRPAFRETTALGAAYLAGQGIGIWKDLSELKRCWKLDRTFSRSLDPKVSEELYKGWKKSVKSTIACTEN